MDKQLTVISLIVYDHYGTLSRISSLFSRKGHNIHALTASNTHDPNQTRITLSVQGNRNETRLIMEQCKKLVDVIDVQILDTTKCVMREIVLVKVKAEVNQRSDIKQVADIYKASIVDLSPDTMILELTGKPTKLDAFLKIMSEDFEIIEVCRTGSTAMMRNSDNLNDI